MSLEPILYTIPPPPFPIARYYGEMRTMFENAAAVCPLSFREAREITQLTDFSGPFHVIPHGTEARFGWHQPMLARHYVMCANARGQKGESLVEQVCSKLGLPFRYVTGVPHEKLHLIYRQAKVFVHSSPDDRMSLTVGEALCSGCRVISSDRDRGNEWFPGLKACNPANEKELEAYIGMAWRSDEWDWRPNERAREMTWEVAARKWLRVYEGVIR